MKLEYPINDSLPNIELVTGQIAKEIERVGHLIERLYGVLNEDNLKLE